MTLAKLAKINPSRLAFIQAQSSARKAARELAMAAQPSFRWKAKFNFLLEIMAEIGEKRIQRENAWGALAEI